MGLSHSEFKDLKAEIEEDMVAKASKAVLNGALKWIGVIAVLGGAGGYAIINSAFQRQLTELARENRQEIDSLARELNDQLRQARYEVMRVEHVREEMERSTASVERLDETTQDLFERAENASKITELVQSDFTMELPIVLFTRDQVIGQVAKIEREMIAADDTDYPLKEASLAAEGWLSDGNQEWGERKIIILRERPAGQDNATAEFQLRGLSSSLRIDLARLGYEVEEWVTKPGQPERDVASLFSDGGASATFNLESAALLAHKDFDGPQQAIADLQTYLQRDERLPAVQAVANAEFAPSEGYRFSFSDLQAELPKFDVSELAVLFLPIDIVQ